MVLGQNGRQQIINFMKPVLLILSDLFGKENDTWIQYYTSKLETTFTIIYYDSRVLGHLKNRHDDKSGLHQQFVEYGIKNAVNNLIGKHPEKVTVLAFSIAGIIAWKAALNGLNVDKMYLISSTRLRYEKEKPFNYIYLNYGENDIYKPNSEWLNNFSMSYELVKNSGHDIYKSEKNACIIFNKLTQQNTL